MQLSTEASQYPIPLVYVSQDGKYLLHQDGIQFLKNIPKPLAIVTVAGMYRTGKSYLLNRVLLNRSGGFGVGSTVNACTKGLWCWNTIIKGTTPNGDKVNVVIIDTEGIGALDEDQTHDTRIFTLAVLAASSFIYNSMGSIDENALMNLGLIVNLTKSIQLNQDQEQDPQELAKYFPKFTWIVRDFSLQLVTAQGQPITPNEYLQRSLQPQKGFTDDIQQKNRIRHLLSSFFTQRQCHTLVRPLLNEVKLQKLDELDMSQLRTEFVQQILTVRKRVLNRAKVKLLKGQPLDGQMFTNLLQSYTNAINNGAIPNISSAWNQICAIKCQQASEQAIEMYKQATTVISLPHAVQQFQEILQSQENICLQNVQFIGENVKECQTQLKKNISNIKQTLREENQKLSLNYLKQTFIKGFNTIQKKVISKQCTTYPQYCKLVYGVHSSLCESTPNLPKKDIIYGNLLRKVLQDGAEHYLKLNKTQHDKEKTIFQDKIHNLQKSLESVHTQYQQQKIEKTRKISSLKADLESLTTQKQNLLDQVQTLRNSHTLQISSLQNRLRQETDNHIQVQQNFQNDILVLKNQLSSIKDKSLQDKKQHQIQMELKQKKFSYEISQLKQKCQDLQQQITKQQSEFQQSKSSLIQNYERKIVELANKTNQSSKDFLSLQQSYNIFKKDQESLILKQQTEKEDLQKQVAKLSAQLDTTSSQISQNMHQEISKHVLTISTLERKLQQINSDYLSLEKSSKINLDKLKQNCTEYQREIAILTQSLEFSKQELEEAQSKQKHISNSYQHTIQQIEHKYAHELKQRQRELAQQSTKIFQEKMDAQVAEYEAKIKTLQQQLSQHNEELTKRMLEQDVARRNAEAEKCRLSNMVQEMQTQLQSAQQLYNQTISSLQHEWKLKQMANLTRISFLQEELTKAKDQSLNSNLVANRQSEEIIKQMKNYYQIQKDRLEAKVIQEKQRFEKNTDSLTKYYEEKLISEVEPLEEQIQALKQQLFSLDAQHKEIVGNMQHQIDIIQKTLQSSERSLGEERVRAQGREKEYALKEQALSKTVNTVKNQYQNKISDLRNSKSMLQRQLSSISHENNQYKQQLKDLQEAFTGKNKQFTVLQTNYASYKEETGAKLSLLNGQHMEAKIQYETKSALLLQQKQFNMRKIQDLQKNIEGLTTNFEQKLRKLRLEHNQQISSLKEKFTTEHEQLSLKYESLKKNSKESQSTNNRTMVQLQRELSLEKEKSQQQEFKINELLFAKKTLQDQFAQIQDRNTSNFKKQREQMTSDIAQLKLEINELESDKQQLESTLQRQKMLLEKKISFIEEGKQKYKRQAQDAAQKLAQVMENAQKTRQADQSNYKQTYTSLQQSHSKREQKLNVQISQLKSLLTKKQHQQETAIAALNSELRTLTQKYSSEQQTYLNYQVQTQQKSKIMQQTMKRLNTELERVRASHSLSEIQQQLEKDKDLLRNKISERDDRLKTVQRQKQDMLLSFQKQKTRWFQQIETYKQKNEELRTSLTNLERQQGRLQRENDKMKTEKRCSSRFGLPNRMSLQRSMSKSNLEDLVNKSIQKENSALNELSFFGNNQQE